MDQAALQALSRDHERFRWLAWALDHTALRRRPDHVLLDELARGISPEDREAVLREIEFRLGEWPTSTHRSLAAVLARRHRAHSAPGVKAQETDRLLRRMLRQIRGETARTLAFSCASCSRLPRRQAAWKYYAAQGLDDAARDLLAQRADSETDERFWLLVAHDAESIERVGFNAALQGAPGFYWRGRTLETWLGTRNTVPQQIASQYPAETLFAIRRARRHDLTTMGVGLFEANRDDPDVVGASIRLFGDFGIHEPYADAARTGERLLNGVPGILRDLLGLPKQE